MRVALALFFMGAGLLHFVAPGAYEGIMPPALPYPRALIYASGLAEMLGGAGLLVPRTRRWAGVGLALLLIAVFPANVQMLLNWRARHVGPVAEALLWLRLPFQGVLIWWAWRLSRGAVVPQDGG